MEEHNPGRESNALTAFDNMIADMINNKKLNPLVVESEIPCCHHTISFHSTTKCYTKLYTSSLL